MVHGKRHKFSWVLERFVYKYVFHCDKIEKFKKMSLLFTLEVIAK